MLKKYFDTYYKCSVINLEEKIIMHLGQRLLTKNPNGNDVIEVVCIKIYDLEWVKSDDIMVQDLVGNKWITQYWLVRPIEKEEIKELNPNEVKSTEIKYKPIIEPIKESE
jgi:hypothetical protein